LEVIGMAELSKDLRIKREIKRLNAIYSDLDENALASIEGLIRRAAYMRVTLEDYEADLDANGYVEMFTQSERTPPYERERPVARLYNSMNRNYQTIMKQLVDALPDTTSSEASREIMEFVSGAR
jgi:hypothetical protein